MRLTRRATTYPRPTTVIFKFAPPLIWPRALLCVTSPSSEQGDYAPVIASGFPRQTKGSPVSACQRRLSGIVGGLSGSALALSSWLLGQAGQERSSPIDVSSLIYARHPESCMKTVPERFALSSNLAPVMSAQRRLSRRFKSSLHRRADAHLSNLHLQGWRWRGLHVCDT